MPESEWNSISAVVDPDGVGPRLFFQRVPEPKVGKTRVHLDLNVGGGHDVPVEERKVRVDAAAQRLVGARRRAGAGLRAAGRVLGGDARSRGHRVRPAVDADACEERPAVTRTSTPRTCRTSAARLPDPGDPLARGAAGAAGARRRLRRRPRRVQAPDRALSALAGGPGGARRRLLHGARGRRPRRAVHVPAVPRRRRARGRRGRRHPHALSDVEGIARDAS